MNSTINGLSKIIYNYQYSPFIDELKYKISALKYEIDNNKQRPMCYHYNGYRWYLFEHFKDSQSFAFFKSLNLRLNFPKIGCPYITTVNK